jgi:hypothetical protein
MNILYPSFKDGLLTSASWVNDATRIALYNAGALYDPTHNNLSQIAGVQVAQGDSDMAGNTAIDGFAIGPPVEYSALTSPEDVAIAIIYRFSDGALIAFLDVVYGFNFQPIGEDYALSPGGPGGSYFAL